MRPCRCSAGPIQEQMVSRTQSWRCIRCVSKLALFVVGHGDSNGLNGSANVLLYPNPAQGGPAKSNPVGQNPPNSRKSGCKAQLTIRQCLAATPQAIPGESMQIAVRAGRVKELKMSRSTVRLQNTSRSRGAWTGLASLPRGASPFRGLCCDQGTPGFRRGGLTLSRKIRFDVSGTADNNCNCGTSPIADAFFL